MTTTTLTGPSFRSLLDSGYEDVPIVLGFELARALEADDAVGQIVERLDHQESS
jgi:hypothetical protein